MYTRAGASQCDLSGMLRRAGLTGPNTVSASSWLRVFSPIHVLSACRMILRGSNDGSRLAWQRQFLFWWWCIRGRMKIMKKSLGSFRRGRPRGTKRNNMKINARKLDRETKALMRLRDDQIDTSDIPEVKDWNKAVVGKFYRPMKEPVTIRLDADVVAWLKSQGPGYQTRINALLRQAMSTKSRSRRS